MAQTLLVAIVLATNASQAGSPRRELGIGDFFRPAAIEHVKLNPAGDLYVAARTTLAITSLRVEEVSRKRGADIIRFAISEAPEIALLHWVDDRTLLVSLRGQPRNHVVRVNVDEAGIELEMQQMVQSGKVVDWLFESGDDVLFSPYSEPRDLYRVPVGLLTADSAGGSSPFTAARRVTRMTEPVAVWAVDHTGAPRVAVTRDANGNSHFWYAGPGRDDWKPDTACAQSGDPWRVPIGLTADGRSHLVAAPSGSGRIGLYACEPDGSRAPVPVFEHAVRDVQGLLEAGGDDQIEGLYYHDRGRTRIHWFDPVRQKDWKSIERQFAGADVWPVSESSRSGTRVVWVGGRSDPGRMVLLNAAHEVTELGRVAPWLDGHSMGEVTTFQIDIPGVGPVESHLTLPRADGRLPPLIVYPHGGPIGVSDEPGFNDAVQFLASAGYAVLQVNYRGSGGLGREFEKSGWHQWGRGIEDDIDAAVEHVLSQGRVDRHRLCIVGESYGGYSALISTVRHPDRYRCAASLAGVTDIALLLDTADYGRSQQGREMFAQIIGDPILDHEEMNHHSPVYRVAEMKTPLLIIQGDEDVRVDLEHALRLAAMLELHSKPHELVILPGLGHDGWSRRDLQWYFHTLRKFLDAHLS